MHIVKIWLEKYFFPTKDEVILPRLLELAQMHAKISPKDGQAFVDLVKKKMSEAGTLSLNSSIGRMSPRTLRTRQTDRFGISRDTQSEPPPTPNLPRSVSVALKTRNLANMTDIDPLEMARQLTIMDNKQFCAVHPYELINQEFTRKDSRIAVNVRGMTDLSNQMSTWAAESILFESDLRRRVAILKYLIKVADVSVVWRSRMRMDVDLVNRSMSYNIINPRY
jgi:son of sevenless-like protein